MTIDTFTAKFVEKKLPYIQIGNKFYLADEEMVEISKKMNCKVESIGIFLGEEKGSFMPSLALLELLSNESHEKVFLTDMGVVDFVYGRNNLKRRHIDSFTGSPKPGFMKLVQTKHDENLGYCKIKQDLSTEEREISSLKDRGDFLRREKKS